MPAKRKEEKKQEEDIDLSTLPPWISVFTMIEWDASLSEVASLFPIFQFSLITRSDLFNYSKEKGYIANNVTEATIPTQTLAKSLSEKVNSMDLQARKAKRDQMQRLEVQERPQRTESRQTSQVFTEVSVPNNYPIKPDRTYILLNFPKTLEEITTTARYGINIEFFFYIRSESSPAASQILPHFREAFQRSEKNSPLRTFLEKTIVYDLSKYQGMESEVAKLEEAKIEKNETSVQQETEKQLRSSKTMKKATKEIREEVSTPAQPDLRKLFIAELVKNILETGVLYVKYLIWKETAPCRPLFPSYIIHEVLETTSNTTVSYNGEFGRHFELPSLDDAAKAWDFRVFDYLFTRAEDRAASVEYFLVCIVEQLLNSQKYLQNSSEVLSEPKRVLNENDFLTIPYLNIGLVDRPASQALYSLYDNFNFPITADKTSQLISSDKANFFFSSDKQELRWMMIINRFEEIISSKTGKKTQLSREFGELLSRPVLNATIQRLLKYSPDVVFCKHDGVTLLGFFFDPSGPSTCSWEHSRKIRPNFQDWKEFNLYPSDFYDVDELKIGVVNSQEFNLYPANGGVLKQIKYSVAQKSLKRCFGLVKDWVFGLQDSGNEAFAVIPDYRITADLSSVKLTTNGQIISANAQEVLLELTETRMKERLDLSGLKEKNRVVTGKASVIRYLEDGSIQVLYSNGNVSSYNGRWVVTNNRGIQVSEGREVGLVPCASVTDPKTGLRTVFRDDGTVILYYPQHTVVEFQDGTKILTTIDEYLVESPAYPPVRIDKKTLAYQVFVDETTQIIKKDENIEILLKNQLEKVTFSKNSLILSDFTIDLALSNISCKDFLGNFYQIGLNQEASQQICQKVETFNDFPRLFAVDESGSGVEVLSSEQLSSFLSPSCESLECQVEEKTFSVFCRPLNKQSLDKGHLAGSFLSDYRYSEVFELIKPAPKFLNSDETTQVSFRYFEKYPKSDPQKRESFKEKYNNYIEWQSKQNQGREFGFSEFSIISFNIHLKSILERSQVLQLKTEKTDPKDFIRKLVESHCFSPDRKKTQVRVDEGLAKICESPVQKGKSRKFTFDSRSVSSTMHSFNYFKSPEGIDVSFMSQVQTKSPENPKISPETSQKPSETKQRVQKEMKESLKPKETSDFHTITESKFPKDAKDREIKTSKEGKDLNESFEENPFISLSSKPGKKVVLKPVSGPSVYSQVEKLQKLRESSEKSIAEEYHMSKNMNFDLIGGLRKSLPHVPALRSTSPAMSKVNLKYLTTDLMTETKIRTISQTRRSIFKQPNSITSRRESNPGLSKSVFIQDYVNDPFKRLLEIIPDSANFGNVMVGQVASLKLIVKNEDSTLVRFAVKQPSVKDVKVIYRPGPIAPGMITKFIVELNSKEIGKISAEFEVLCKSEIYTIPILANVVNDETALMKHSLRGLSEKVRQRKLPALNKSIA